MKANTGKILMAGFYADFVGIEALTEDDNGKYIGGESGGIAKTLLL